MINGMSGSECTSKVLPSTGIKVTNAKVHMHLTGKRIRLRHFREGVELSMIAEDNFYDFNYQVPRRTLKEEITILPGDEFYTECEYQTKDVKRYVIGGLATNQEMCQVFFFYYPRVPLSQCTSQYEFNDFKGLEIDEIEGEKVLKALHLPYEPHLLPPGEREKDLGDDARELEAIEEGISFKSVFNHMNITKPSSLKGKVVGKYLEELKWTEEMGRKLENFWKQGKHYQFCSKPGLKRVVLNNHVIEYPEIKKARQKDSSPFCSSKTQESSTESNVVGGGVGILTFSFVVVAVLVVLVIIGIVSYFKFFH